MIKKQAWIVICVCVLLTSALVAPAEGTFSRLVGSWEVVATFDGSGDEVPFLATYGRGGTLISTGPPATTTASQGAWKRTGARTFSTRSIILLLDANGDAAFRGESTSEIEVSADGESYTGTFRAEIQALDGTVLQVNTGTESGTRIDVD